MFFLKDEQLRSIFGKQTTYKIKNGAFLYYEKLSHFHAGTCQLL